MQFKRSQRGELARTWNRESWFYSALGEPARRIVESAYGLRAADPKERTRCQEDVTLVLSIFARKTGCDKAQACRALLTGSLRHLQNAIDRKRQAAPTEEELRAAWVDSFREINMG